MNRSQATRSRATGGRDARLEERPNQDLIDAERLENSTTNREKPEKEESSNEVDQWRDDLAGLS